jgi:hypothetical protein
MKITKISANHYTFNEATVSSVYNKEDKSFTFTINRDGFQTITSVQKNLLVFDSIVESFYNGMVPVVVESSLDLVDIDGDLTEDELMLANYIRSFTPEANTTTILDLPESQDDVLLALNAFLSSDSEDDYASFRDALDSECAAAMVEELAIS